MFYKTEGLFSSVFYRASPLIQTHIPASHFRNSAYRFRRPVRKLTAVPLLVHSRASQIAAYSTACWFSFFFELGWALESYVETESSTVSSAAVCDPRSHSRSSKTAIEAFFLFKRAQHCFLLLDSAVFSLLRNRCAFTRHLSEQINGRPSFHI